MNLLLLPAELQLEIVSYLSRPDLKSARGVCRTFRDTTSEFLFRSVVACARYQALGAMQKIALHSVYPAYVKEIIFDGSVYDAVLANNEDMYHLHARAFPEIQHGFSWHRHQRYVVLYFPYL